MNHLRLNIFLLSLMSLVATPVFADETKAILPEKEEDIPVEFIPTLDTTISVGFRHLNNGPRVVFGNLGSMPQPITVDPNDPGTGFLSHRYTDGYAVADVANVYEKNISGNLLAVNESFGTTNYISQRNADGTISIFTSIPEALNNVKNSDGNYVPKTTSVLNPDGSVTQTNVFTWAQTGRFLAYQAGRARNWAVLNKSQIYQRTGVVPSTPANPTGAKSYVDMHADGVTSAGASLEADSTGSSGFTLAMERRLGKRGRLEWGVSAGLDFSYVNAKAAGTFPAYLLRTTDTYALVDTGLNSALLLSGGVDPTQPGNAKDLTLNKYYPAGEPLVPGTVFRYIDPTTEPLSKTVGADGSLATPLDTANVQWGTPTIAGTVMIHGNYRLKGAYLLTHVGPTFRYNFNDRWAVSGTFGLALAWAGSNFRATEYYNTWNDLPAALRPDLEGNTTEYHLSQSNSTHKFTLGLYCDLNMEYWVTDRTGFYAGFSGQSLRSYNQNRIGDRIDKNNNVVPGLSATVDMGKNAGWTIGIKTRF